MAENAFTSDDELREFDELTRMEAAERGESYESPFDVAAHNAAPEDDAPPALEFGAIPAPKPKKKRDRKTSGRRPGRPKKAGATGAPRPAAASGDVKGPPPPAAAGAPSTPAPGMPAAALPSAQLVPLIKRLDAMIAARAGTEPLSEQEAREGADVLGPLLHHYAPAVLNSNQPWVPAAVWVALTYGPRALDRATTDPRAQLATPAEASASPPVDFPEPVATQGRRGDPAPVAPGHPSDAVAPVFRNPLVDLPDAPMHGTLG